MSIRHTYATAHPQFKAHMPIVNDRQTRSRNVSHRSMGKPETLNEARARELLDHNDDWPTRRRRFRPHAKHLATVARRQDSKRLIREASDGGHDLIDLTDQLLTA